METRRPRRQMRYATALAECADAGGYELEVVWDVCTVAALGVPVRPGEVPRAHARCPAASRSGWCWSPCCAAPTRCCCSTSPTTTSTCPASAGSRSSSRESPKTILLVSHDRELLDHTPRPGSSPSSSGAAGNTRVDAPRRLRVVPRGAPRPVRRASRSCAGAGTRSTPSSRRWCCMYKIEGGVQRRHGVALPGRADPARASSRRPARRPSAARAAGADAAARRPHRQARGGLRAASS